MKTLLFKLLLVMAKLHIHTEESSITNDLMRGHNMLLWSCNKNYPTIISNISGCECYIQASSLNYIFIQKNPVSQTKKGC